MWRDLQVSVLLVLNNSSELYKYCTLLSDTNTGYVNALLFFCPNVKLDKTCLTQT